jgi:N-acetylglucosamine kinase-like BadF-type ATPase
MSEPTYIAVDGGGTKTEAALFTADGEVLFRARRGGCNPNIVGLDASCGVLSDVFAELSVASPSPPRGYFAGVAGALTGGNAAEMEKRLRPSWPNLIVESDIMNVVYSAENPGPCIAAIMGTGSSVFAYDGQQLHRAGGWGYLFDLSGGGFDIGREVLRACLAHDDGMAPASQLVALAEQRLGGRALDLLATFYAKGPDYVASFAPIAFEALRAGDVAARDIVLASVRHVAKLVRHVRDHYRCGNRAVFSGGLLRDRDILEPMLREAIGADIAFEFPSRPQIEGALRRCRTLFKS